MKHLTACICLWITSSICHAQTLAPRKLPIDFSLPSADGQTVCLPSHAKVVVVCFLGTECPLARQYAPRLQRLADRYQTKAVAFVGVDSNPQDSMEEVVRFRQGNNLKIPIGMDYDQRVAEMLGAERTPEVVVLDDRRSIRYQGRIDDQFKPGVAKSESSVSELVEAIDALLAGQPVRVPHTKSVGCLISKANRPIKASESHATTYAGSIARIFQTHCVECHRSGEIGPFAMTDYEELRGWGDMIVEVIDQGRMPPWHAAPGHVPLRNARSISDTEKQLVRDWVAAGMPYGDAALVPPQTAPRSQWHLPREPDLVVTMRKTAYDIPAEGTVDYQYFVVDPGLTEDRWVSAAQVIPGNPGVVHHAIVFIRPPSQADFQGVSWLTAYVPGQRGSGLPAGSARRIPAGSKLVFQMHYTPNGTPQSDTTRVGMVFADEESVGNEVITLMAINQEFEIPPHVSNHAVTAQLKQLPRGGQLLAVSPHMHVRGKSFQLAMRRNGQREIVLDVPKYDFNWQHTYEFAEPLLLDSMDALEFTATFDNSRDNPVNPNPETLVTWGDQTWEEMAVAFFEVSRPRHGPSGTSPNASDQPQSSADRQTQAEKFADDFLQRLDVNRNGRVSYEEAPLAVQRFSFGRFDRNHDRSIDRQELVAAGLERAAR